MLSTVQPLIEQSVWKWKFRRTLLIWRITLKFVHKVSFSLKCHIIWLASRGVHTSDPVNWELMINFCLKLTGCFNHSLNSIWMGYGTIAFKQLYWTSERDSKWTKDDDVRSRHILNSVQSQTIRIFVQMRIKLWWVNDIATTFVLYLQCRFYVYTDEYCIIIYEHFIERITSTRRGIDTQRRHRQKTRRPNTLYFLRKFFAIFNICRSSSLVCDSSVYAVSDLHKCPNILFTMRVQVFRCFLLLLIYLYFIFCCVPHKIWMSVAFHRS